MNTSVPLAVVILAAGKGKRMNNPNISKVMAQLAGKPLIGHVLSQVDKLSPEHTVLIVGYQREGVISYVEESFPDAADFAVQHEQLGTGHAVAQAEEHLKGFTGDVLILSGDVPCLRAETLHNFVAQHNSSDAVISVLSVHAPDPKGYGRIIRDEKGNFMRIVEEKDATDEQRSVTEINSGIYIVDGGHLFSSLKDVSNTNAQGEYYLTDIIEIIRRRDLPVCAFPIENFEELQGINTVEELARAEESFRRIFASEPA